MDSMDLIFSSAATVQPQANNTEQEALDMDSMALFPYNASADTFWGYGTIAEPSAIPEALPWSNNPDSISGSPIQAVALPHRPRVDYVTHRDKWLEHRRTIVQLYNSHTLTKVVEIMERVHGFRASESMYKRRLKTWTESHKYKRPEWRKTRKRPQPNSHGMSAHASATAQLMEWRPGVDLDAGTPRRTSCSPQRFIGIPQLDTPQKIMNVLRDYVEGSIVSGLWIVSKQLISVSGLRGAKQRRAFAASATFYQGAMFALRLLQIGHIREAEEGLIVALAELDLPIRSQDPYLICSLLSAIYMYVIRGFSDAAVQILRHVGNMSSTILGDTHPLACAFKWLNSMKTAQIGQYAGRVIHSLGDVALRCGGHENHWTRDAQRVYTLHVKVREEPENALLEARHRFVTSMNTRGLKPQVTKYDLIDFIEILMALDKFEEALSALRLVIGDDVDHFIFHLESEEGVRFCWYYAQALIRLHHYQQAEQLLRAGMRKAESIFGPDDPEILRWMLQLEQWMEKDGRADEAAALRSERLARHQKAFHRALV